MVAAGAVVYFFTFCILHVWYQSVVAQHKPPANGQPPYESSPPYSPPNEGNPPPIKGPVVKPIFAHWYQMGGGIKLNRNGEPEGDYVYLRYVGESAILAFEAGLKLQDKHKICAKILGIPPLAETAVKYHKTTKKFIFSTDFITNYTIRDPVNQCSSLIDKRPSVYFYFADETKVALIKRKPDNTFVFVKWGPL